MGDYFECNGKNEYLKIYTIIQIFYYNPFWKEKDWLPTEYRNVESKHILVINDMQHAIQLAVKNKVVFLTADVEMSKCYDEI